MVTPGDMPRLAPVTQRLPLSQVWADDLDETLFLFRKLRAETGDDMTAALLVVATVINAQAEWEDEL